MAEIWGGSSDGGARGAARARRLLSFLGLGLVVALLAAAVPPLPGARAFPSPPLHHPAAACGRSASLLASGACRPSDRSWSKWCHFQGQRWHLRCSSGASGGSCLGAAPAERRHRHQKFLLSSATADSSSFPVVPVTNTDRFLEMVGSTKARRLYVWAGFFALAASLRGFYGVILGTFLLSYSGNTAVNKAMAKGNQLLGKWNLPVKSLPRPFYALSYILLLQSLIISLTVLTVPRLNVEFQFLASIGEKENPYMLIVDWVRTNFGPEALHRLEPFLLTVTGEPGRVFAGYEANAQELIAASTLKAKAVWSPERNAKFAKLVQFYLGGYLRKGLGFTKLVVGQLTNVLYKATLSLLFSFMIVWDLPRLRKGMKTVRESKRLRFAYETVGPQVENFAGLVGQSFEVQFLIALANTILTTLGLVILKVRGAFVLSTVVFLCSFVPVAGVFISTLPMVLAALSDYGMMKVFEVIGMVLIVHALEAYFLNPYLYASKLKLHPIVVLAVLYMTEHVVGVQGLILAVPVAVYVINSILGVPAAPAPSLPHARDDEWRTE